MPKKRYVLRKFAPGSNDNGRKSPNTLFSISSASINFAKDLTKSSLSLGVTETSEGNYDGLYTDILPNPRNAKSFSKYRDIVSVSGEFIAFFNKSYPLRRDYLRQFAQNGEINFVLETIADETIVYDSNNYFASLDLDKLKSKIRKDYEKADNLIEACNIAFKRIYSLFGFNDSNDAWSYLKKFLIDGFLAFEIIFDYDSDTKQAKDIIAFKEIDPITLEPDVITDQATGTEFKIWYQYRGDQEKERIIPDSNLIYISWAKGTFIECTRISYLEGLTRSFNMLRQIENSRMIWNIQNAQKRIKISVPLGSMSPDRAKNRLSQLQAYYNEDTTINTDSGEVTVNGMPNFSFTKTYMFPKVNGDSTDISELGVEGYDMNSTDQLKYFWRRFILESKVPANRFMLDPQSPPNNTMGSESVTREEFAFHRFIQRIQAIFQEILLKPIWIQICLKYPELSGSMYLRNSLGIKYNEENLFTLAKERQIISDGATTISSLTSINDQDGKPMFSPEFLAKKYLGLSDEDWMLNEEYKQRQRLKAAKSSESQQGMASPEGMQEGGDFGDFGGGSGFGDFGGGSDFGSNSDFGSSVESGGGEEAGGATSSAPESTEGLQSE